MNLMKEDKNRVFMSEELEKRIPSLGLMNDMSLTISHDKMKYSYSLTGLTRKHDEFTLFTFICKGKPPTKELFFVERATFTVDIGQDKLLDKDLYIREISIDQRSNEPWVICFKAC